MAREFKTLQEVETLSGYHPDNLLAVEQYGGLEGPYHFAEEVKCRLMKSNGNPCGTDHKHGWVLRAKDGAIAIVGGKCALNHFGLQADELRRDMALATNLIEQAKAKEKLAALLADRDERFPEVRAAWERLQACKKSLAALHDQLGQHAWQVLDRMARNNENTVTITGVVPAKFNAKGDEMISDRRIKPVPVGAFKAISVVNYFAVDSSLASLQGLWNAYRRADESLVDSSRSIEAKAFTAALSRHGAVIEQATRAEELVSVFLKNDFRIVAFAIEDKAARYKALSGAFAFGGTPTTRDKAKAWMQEREAILKQSHNVAKIEHNDSWRRDRLGAAARKPFAA